MSKRFQVKFRIKSDPKSTSRNSVNGTMVTASNMMHVIKLKLAMLIV